MEPSSFAKTFVVFAIISDIRDHLLELAFAKITRDGQIIEEAEVRTFMPWNQCPPGLYSPDEAMRILKHAADGSVLITFNLGAVTPVLAPLLKAEEEISVWDMSELYPGELFSSLCRRFDNPQPNRAMGNLTVMVTAFAQRKDRVRSDLG